MNNNQPDSDPLSMENFEQKLAKGEDIQIDPESEYIFNWQCEALTHQVIMDVVKNVIDDPYSNLVVGDAIVFYDELKDVPSEKGVVSKRLKCSGLSITALKILLHEIWKDEEILPNKKFLNRFLENMYDNLIIVEE